jgi:hypothetical protein
MAIRAKEIGSRVVAMEPVAGKAEWLRSNLSLNGCLGVTQELEVALGNERGQVEIVVRSFPELWSSARRSIGFGTRKGESISLSSTLKATRQSSRKVAARQSQRTGQCFS